MTQGGRNHHFHERRERESVRKKIECENLIWEAIEKSMSDSERESRRKRARELQEKLKRKAKDEKDLRQSSQNILQKRKRNGKRKYVIRGVVKVSDMRRIDQRVTRKELCLPC